MQVLNEESPLLCDSSISSSETKDSFVVSLRYMSATELTNPELKQQHDLQDDNTWNSDNIVKEDDHDDHELVSGSTSVSDPEEEMLSSPEKLGVISMAILVFYNVSGGPFGIETTVRAGGNLYALLGFLIMPFVWSLQEALMTAELGTAFPEASGGVVWVEEAFGPLAGWMSGYLNWVSGATDNAIYPALFLDYLLQILATNDNGGNDDSQVISPVLRFCLVSGTTILLAYINWRGLALVGRMSILICVLAMSPFLILVVVGSFKVDPSRWWQLPTANIGEIETTLDDDTSGGFLPNFSSGGILWRPFLNNLFWNLNSFDSAGSLVAELDNTASFVRALMLGLLMVISCYIFPLLIAIGSSDTEQADWEEGYLATINAEVVGPWLGAWTVFAAGISNIGLFQAELSADAFQLMGMADRGYLPKVFRKRSRHGTPTYGIMLGTCIIVAMGVSDVDRLVEMLNFNYGISLLFEYAAFFKLRISRPDLERPYKIPLNTLACGFFFFPTIVATLFVCSLATFATYYFAVGSWIVGYILHVARLKNQQVKLPDSVGGNENNQYMHVGANNLPESMEIEATDGEFT